MYHVTNAAYDWKLEQDEVLEELVYQNDDLEDEYENLLNESEEDLMIAGVPYEAGTVLRRIDSTRFYDMVEQWRTNLASDLQTELDNLEKNETIHFYGWEVELDGE